MVTVNPNNIFVVWPLGSSKPTDSNPYGLGYGLHRPQGHIRLVTDRMKPLYDLGVRQFIRHRPFGEIPGGPMDLDVSAEMARDPNWSWVLDDYDAATRWAKENISEAIIWDYIGAPESDFAERLRRGEFADHWYRLWHSIRRPLEHSNVSIILDAAAGSRYPNGSVYEMFARQLRSYKKLQVRDVRVEALPSVGHWSREFDALCTSRFLKSAIDHKQIDQYITEDAICWYVNTKQWSIDEFLKKCNDLSMIPAVSESDALEILA